MYFTKMHGAGNDYIYINGFTEHPADLHTLAKTLSDRHFGVGSDGLVIILPSDICDFKMRMFNPDGSEAEMCGNAARCIAKFVFDKGLTDKTELTLETKAGVKKLRLYTQNGKVEQVRVDMGEPILSPDAIPVKSDRPILVSEPVEVDSGTFRMTCVSMGNPHAVIFLPDFETFDLHRIGRQIECHEMFPQRTNVEFAIVESPGQIRMRVWERGTGETLACGTGACATLVAAVLNGISARKAILKLSGGDLEIEWDEKDNHVYMTGGATTVFEGVWEQ